MMGRGQTHTLIDLDRDRLTVVEAAVADGTITVSRVASANRPETVAPENHEAVGLWIRSVLDAEGVNAKRVVLAVPRGDVVLKRLSLPSEAADDADDLSRAVYLQMSRQLTMAMEGTVIDYAPLPVRLAPDGAASVVVLAAAMPGDRLVWLKAMAEAGDIGLSRVALRCCGAAALLSEMSQVRGGPVVAAVVAPSSTEFLVVEDGQMAFARAIDAPRPDSSGEIDGFIDRLEVEAKRTWMSHRGATPGADAELVAAIGAGDLAQRVAKRVGEALERPWQVAGVPSLVKGLAGVPAAERTSTDPLIGLLAESVNGLPSIDFLNPRRTRDHASTRRKLVLLGTLGAIVIFGGAYVLGTGDLTSRRRAVSALQTRKSELARQAERFKLEQARLSHAEQWISGQTDLLAHFDAIHQQLPPPGRAIVDGFSANAGAAVGYGGKGKNYPSAEWWVTRRAQFAVDGEAADRAVAAELRSRLVQSGFYSVDSPGPDVQNTFSLRLSSGAERPAPPPAPVPAPAPNPGGEP